MIIYLCVQGKGRKRKLRDNEVVSPSEMPVYKWRRERKKWEPENEQQVEKSWQIDVYFFYLNYEILLNTYKLV